jgi:hypothetical protein
MDLMAQKVSLSFFSAVPPNIRYQYVEPVLTAQIRQTAFGKAKLVCGGRAFQLGRSGRLQKKWRSRPAVSHFYSTSGTHVTVKYQVLQFGAGYQYHYAKTRTKLSVAPSLFVYKYKNTRALQKQQYAAIRPGMAFSGRLPLGKEKKLFGVDVIADLNLVPPVKMKTLTTETITDSGKITTTLNSGSVNLVHGMLGFAFSLRR